MTKAADKIQAPPPEEVLRDIVAGRTSVIPAGGIPGVAISYQSGPKRFHAATTAGPVEITPEGNVLADVQLDGLSMSIERVQYGVGPRTWHLPSPSDPPPKPKTARRGPRYVYPPGVEPTAEERAEIEKEGGEIVSGVSSSHLHSPAMTQTRADT